MADEYTPTIEQVRARFVWTRDGDAQTEAISAAAFERFLAAYEVEVRERIAQDIRDAAEFEAVYESRAMHEAARIATGIAR